MINPSWSHFGTHEQSTHPHLWECCIGAWYPGLGPTGIYLWDHSGFSRPVELKNYNLALAWSSPGGEYSIVGDGSNDHMLVPISGTSMTDFTVSFWVNPNALTVGLWQWANALSSASPYLLLRSNGQVLIDGAYRVTLTLASNTWYHFAISRHGATNTWLVHLNGVQQLSYVDDGTPTSIANATGLYWANGFSGFSDGRFDDMRLYGAALPVDYVKELASYRGIGYQRRPRPHAPVPAGDSSQTISATGIASGNAFGQPTITTGEVTVATTGIASTAAVGQPTVTPGTVTIQPEGYWDGDITGQPTITVGDVTVSLAGLASATALGQPTITTGEVTVVISGLLGSTNFFGDITVTTGAIVSATGIASASVFGSPTVTAGEVTVSPTGIASTEAIGLPIISLAGTQTIAATGIASATTFGSPTITTGEVTVSATGIASTGAIGQPTITVGDSTIAVNGVASTLGIGSVTITTGDVTVQVGAITSALAFGSITITTAAPQTIQLSGVASSTAIGLPLLYEFLVEPVVNYVLDGQVIRPSLSGAINRPMITGFRPYLHEVAN